MRQREFIALWGTMFLSGCADSAGLPAVKLSAVQAGMTRDEVLAVLGPPQRQEAYGSTEFLIYSNDGVSTTALLNFTPIAIVDGRVTGVGRTMYEAVVQAHASRDSRK
jgi:hypothetical protein